MLTTRKVLLVIVLGCMVVAAGFVYFSIFAGIPYQDPTPELLARYNFHASVAGHLYNGGFGIIALGVVLAIIRFIMKRLGHKAA